MYTVSLVGRPNVGKSALFNRLAGRRIAIVDPAYGLTRDRITTTVAWRDRTFNLVDTGGIDFDRSDGLRAMVRRQADLAIAQADTAILVTDVVEGLVPLDDEIAALLRRSGRRTIVAANKADNEVLALAAAEFHRLGFPDVFPVSALHGLGVGVLLDAVVTEIGASEAEEEVEEIRIAVVGRPNVGKSSYVNAVLGEERIVVDESPGTTRDSVDIRAPWAGRVVTLIDTAGMRRTKKVREPADYFSVARTRASIRRCDIALMLVDATEAVSAQDERIARMICAGARGAVLAANKWDLVGGKRARKYREEIWSRMPFFNYVPLVFTSAKFNRGIEKSMKALLFVQEQMMKRIATPLLNRILRRLWQRHEPPVRERRRPKLFYATQPAVNPPRFVLFVNTPELIERSYTHYLTRGLRRAFGFEGAPLVIEYRKR